MKQNRLLVGASDKLALLLHLIQQDFPTGLTVIDPDGRLAEAVADSIPKELTDDTHYFDPSDAKHIASFNVFEGVLEPDRPKLVQDLCAFFDALFPAGAETLTRQSSTFVLANVLTALLDYDRVSFLSILDFLSDERFREECLNKCTNPIAIRNWQAIESWDATQKKNAFAQIEAKVGTLLLSPVLHRTLQDTHSTFYLTKTPILIANLSRQKLGDSAARLLGTLLISRATTPVYVNDFGFFASDYLASLFSQGGYTVALQFLSELPKTVEQHVLGFEEKYVYRTNPEDADKLKFYVGALNPARLVDLSPEEFLPELAIDPPFARRRLRAIRNRSIACHTRPAQIRQPSVRKPRSRRASW